MRSVLTRNSAAWAVGSTGSIIEHAPNVLRREYDAASGVLLGALIEDQATNGYTNPEAPGVDSWRVVGPYAHTDSRNDRGLVWGKIVPEPGEGGDSTNGVRLGAALTTGRQYCLSFFVESAGLSTLLIRRDSGSTSPIRIATLDIIKGSIKSAYENNDTAINAIGNQQYRVDFRFIAEGDATAGYYVKNLDPADADGAAGLWIATPQIEAADFPSSPILGAVPTTRAADKLDAPAGGWLPAGRHTWLGAVRMSCDTRQPTVLGHPDGRIYAESGRLHLDGPGELRQPEAEFAPGDYVPFAWTAELPGAAPDFTIGRDTGDANYWNGHILDINPYPRVLRELEIARWLAR